jgi:hypothetical protein
MPILSAIGFPIGGGSHGPKHLLPYERFGCTSIAVVPDPLLEVGSFVPRGD